MTLDATYPIALLPVRLETRFAGSVLQVRIFPDEIWADTHEAGLTAEERASGDAYVAAQADGPDAERAVWSVLVSRWTAQRAAYIVAAVTSGSTDTRVDSWTRAAQALLPDHWLVRAEQGPNRFTVTSEPVTRPLALTLSPASTPADRVPISDGLEIDTDLQWTLDFETARRAGMAVTIDLTQPDAPAAQAPDPSAGVDLLLVVGVSESQTPDDGATQLRTLLDAQHYTRGVAFLRPGTPTNNTPDSGAPPLPPADPGGAASFAVERSSPLVSLESPANAYGLAFARALGLPLTSGESVAAVEHIEGADLDADTPAAAMNDALWPATLGYFMEQMMAPEFDAATVDTAHGFWVNYVRPGGPLPAFRVGQTPYGILPVVSLDRLDASQRFVSVLRSLRDRYFLPASASVPRITVGSPDPDGDLLKVLAVDASSHILRMRVLLGQETTTNTAGWLGTTAGAIEQAQQLARAIAAAAMLGGIGLAGQTRLGGMDGGAVYELLGAPLVTSAPLSEQFGLEGANGTGVNYIRWLHDNATTNRDAIKNDALPGRSRPLLYRALRHALLLEMDRLAFGSLLTNNVVALAERVEPELVQMTPTSAPLTAYQRIDRVATLPVFGNQLGPYLERLATLADLPTAELERRFGETLDACSHRLDAWITAAATVRLWSLRQATPDGCHLGGFGFVEDLRPAQNVGPSPGGYLHAPSAAHASAAAILRNGFLSRGGSGSAYNIDLSSARVRDALVLLDGARQGEPLAALLGQRIERELHARSLEVLIAPLRANFPLIAGKTPAGDGPIELVAAGNVVDGLALHKAWLAKAVLIPDPSDLTSLSSTELASFHTALDGLDDVIDALSDVLTAEAIFQAVRGNTAAAAASLDAMAAGVLPPIPEVTRSPLGGDSFTQRLAIALAPGHTLADDWGTATPRAAAEPALDHWIGTLLGSPAKIGCQVLLADGSKHDVRLGALAPLRPIDFVALARTQPSGLGDSELDRRVLSAIDAPSGAKVAYDTTTASWSIADALELARTIAGLLAVARPLAPEDLVVPAEAGSATFDHDAAAEAAARAQAALDSLKAATAALDSALAAVPASPATATAAQIATLRGALAEAAAFGIAGAYPARDADAPSLIALAAGIRKELAARQVPDLPTAATEPAALAAAAMAASQEVFGRDFFLLPRVPSADLVTPLAASHALVGDGEAPRRALQQLSRVRGNLSRWRALWLYGQAFGAKAPALEVAQLPAADAWVGNPGATVASGTLSLIVHRPTDVAPADGWVGLVVDEWTETIPSAVGHTALAFRHASPVAEPPQTVLLAVPPSATATWDQETLVDTVREALNLAKIRAVDSSLLDGLRPFLPAICLTGNTANETVSTDFLSSLVTEANVKAT
jgi:hypothetical protein